MKRNNWITYLGLGIMIAGLLLSACERSASTSPIVTETPNLLTSLPIIPALTATPQVSGTPETEKEATLSTGQATQMTTEATVEATPLVKPTENNSPYLGQHTVKKGETLYMIGRAYGVDPSSIAATNKIADPDHISPGIVLNIPKTRWPGGVPPGPTAVQQFEPVF